jgi:hypothetical protein
VAAVARRGVEDAECRGFVSALQPPPQPPPQQQQPQQPAQQPAQPQQPPQQQGQWQQQQQQAPYAPPLSLSSKAAPGWQWAFGPAAALAGGAGAAACGASAPEGADDDDDLCCDEGEASDAPSCGPRSSFDSPSPPHLEPLSWRAASPAPCSAARSAARSAAGRAAAAAWSARSARPGACVSVYTDATSPAALAAANDLMARTPLPGAVFGAARVPRACGRPRGHACAAAMRLTACVRHGCTHRRACLCTPYRAAAALSCTRAHPLTPAAPLPLLPHLPSSPPSQTPAGGVAYEPVAADSLEFQLAAAWQFPAFAVALGCSYFRRLLAAMPHLAAAARRCPALAAYSPPSARPLFAVRRRGGRPWTPARLRLRASCALPPALSAQAAPLARRGPRRPRRAAGRPTP